MGQKKDPTKQSPTKTNSKNSFFSFNSKPQKKKEEKKNFNTCSNTTRDDDDDEKKKRVSKFLAARMSNFEDTSNFPIAPEKPKEKQPIITKKTISSTATPNSKSRMINNNNKPNVSKKSSFMQNKATVAP